MGQIGILRGVVKKGLVSVDKIRPRALNGAHHLVQRRRVQHIVVVQQGDVFALHQGQGGVGVAGDAQVLRELSVADAAVGGHIFPADGCHIAMLSVAAVGQTELPAAVGLGQHGIHHLPQKPLRRVVQRHDDAEADVPGEHVPPLLCQLRLGKQGLPCDGAVVIGGAQ